MSKEKWDSEVKVGDRIKVYLCDGTIEVIYEIIEITKEGFYMTKLINSTSIEEIK